MKLRQQQFKFNRGEMDPLLVDRSDLDAYFSAARKMRNVMALPQGGFTRAPGTEYIDELLPQLTRRTGMTVSAPNGGVAASAADDSYDTTLITVTAIGTTNPYVVVHYDFGAAVEVDFADVVGMVLNTHVTNSEFRIQYSTDDVTFTDYGDPIPLNDSLTSRRRAGNVTARYWRVARVGGTDLGAAVCYLEKFNLWAKSSTLSQARLVYFNFTTDQRYAILLTDRSMRVYKSGVLQSEVTSPYTSAQLATIDWAHQDDAIIFSHGDEYPHILERRGADTEWSMCTIVFTTIPKYRFTETSEVGDTTLTPSAVTGTIDLTLTAGTGLRTWTAADVGQYVDGNGGYARIVAITSTLVAKAIVEIPFYDTSGIATPDWTIESGWEPAWSSTRGWPRAVTFYEGRLWFAGHSSLLSLVWGSRVDLPFDFDVGQNLDDDAIIDQIRSDEVPEIFAIYPGRNLQIFTSTDERWVPQSPNTPLTPSNFETKSSGNKHGIKQGTKVFESGGASMFVQAGGKAVREFVYSFQEDSYTAGNLSWASSHLIVTPVDNVLRRATSTSEADLHLLVNSDGTLAIFSIMRDQQVNGWVLRNTKAGAGLFKNVGIDGNDIYVVVERVVNTATVRYLEKINDNSLLDCALIGTVSASTASISGLDFLEGETVKVIGDGYVQADQVVSGGAITFETAVTSSYQIGINLTPYVQPMPVAEKLQDGTILGRLKRIARLTFSLYETTHIVANGNEVPFWTFGEAGAGSPLDTTITPFTGIKNIDGLLGWTEDGNIEITQSVPAAMTVRSLEARIEI